MSFLRSLFLETWRKSWRLLNIYRTSFLYHFLVVLTIIFNRGVYKQKRSFSIPIVKSNSLLIIVFISNTDISSYFNCINGGFPFYEMSLLESSRYIRCIQSNRSSCNVIKVIPSQFQNIIS